MYKYDIISMKKKRALALATTAAVMTAGMQSAVEQPVPRYSLPVTAEQAAFTEQTFNTAKQYWMAHGVPAMSEVQLDIVSGNDTFACYGAQIVTSAEASEYCAAGQARAL
jgi:hypothetical protein